MGLTFCTSSAAPADAARLLLSPARRLSLLDGVAEGRRGHRGGSPASRSSGTGGCTSSGRSSARSEREAADHDARRRRHPERAAGTGRSNSRGANTRTGSGRPRRSSREASVPNSGPTIARIKARAGTCSGPPWTTTGCRSGTEYDFTPTILWFPWFNFQWPWPVVEGWRFTGYGNEVLPYNREIRGIAQPSGTKPEGMMFAEELTRSLPSDSERDLYLPGHGFAPSGTPVLRKTPGAGPFRLLYPHQATSITAQDPPISLQHPIFFQDDAEPSSSYPSPSRSSRSGGPDPRGRTVPSEHPRRLPARPDNRPRYLSVRPRTLRPRCSPNRPPGAGRDAGTRRSPRHPGLSPVPAFSGVSAGSWGEMYSYRSRPWYGYTPWPYLPIFRNDRSYGFETFYHPYLSVFMRALNRDGVNGLLQRSVQVGSRNEYFKANYDPTGLVRQPYPLDDVDFSEGGAYCAVQLGAVLPRPVHDRRPPEQEPALRGGPEVVPLHLRPHRRLAA